MVQLIRTALVALTLSLPANGQEAFPVQVDARFDLIDQTGARRTERDSAGRTMVIFFGYANCESICGVALPTLGQALDLLEPADLGRVDPILITIDPDRDTPPALASALPHYHPALIGLTGSEPALALTRDRFNVEVTELFQAPDGTPVYAHGSFIYVIGPDGALKSLLPPILGPERMADLIRKAL